MTATMTTMPTASESTDPRPPETFLSEARGPCTAPLDAAADYVRSHAERVLPLYVLAMAPHAVVTIPLIDAIAAGRRSAIATWSLWLAAATVWRWVWLARLQYGVQRDLRGGDRPKFWSKVLPILHVRLWGNFAVTWGSVLAGVPAFYGLYVGSFAAPLLLEADGPAVGRVRTSLSWIHHSGRRLVRVLLVMTVLAVVLVVALFVSQAALASTVLPTFLGVDTADLNVTLDSWPWRLRVLYFAFLLLDAFWTVAAVFVYYDSQNRRMATDLRVRLRLIRDLPS